MNNPLETTQSLAIDPLERTGVLNLLWTERDLNAIFGEGGDADCLEWVLQRAA